MPLKLLSYILVFGSVIVVAGCELLDTVDPDDGVVVQAPPGLGPVPSPAHNPLTTAKVALGEKLFFDPVLSRDGTIACSSCHDPQRAFSDSRAVSAGIDGRRGRRNAPGLVNVAYKSLLFWDGGSLSLENQVMAPLEDPNEMDADVGDVLRRLNADEVYVAMFNDAFSDSASVPTLTQAIAAYQRSIVGRGSTYDRYLTGDSAALSESAKKGLALFNGDAGCAVCHAGARFTDDSFRNNGLAFANADSGRARITQNPADFALFRVPSLRNVALTSPYMHDGRLSTLEDVVAHYDSGGTASRGQDARIRALGLSSQQRSDLVAFLRSLTDKSIRAGMNKVNNGQE
jgi:cytochrome c peroxidase